MHSDRPDLIGVELGGGRRFAAARSGEPLRGVDVSQHQDPATLDLSDVDVLHVRATYGVRRDNRFAEHVNRAVQAGVPLIGAYHFFRQGQPAGEQWGAFRSACEGLPLNAAPALDLEWNTRYDGQAKRSAHNTTGREICRRMVDEYSDCLIYTSPGFWRDVLGAPSWITDRPLWLAHYTTAGEPNTLGSDELDLWCGHQYQGAPLDRSVWRSVPVARGRSVGG